MSDPFEHFFSNPPFQMVDVLVAGSTVEIRVRGDGETIWVNVNGCCALRIHKPKIIVIEDERGYLKKKQQSVVENIK